VNLQKADLQLEVKKELARRRLYDYCKLMHPNFYLEDRVFLKDLCDSIQDFLENSNFKFLVINLPPRHGKSYTAKNTTEWLFGHNPNIKVMTASYNETLSTTFARQVRDNIDSTKTGDNLVYSDIFPKTKIKKGDASASLWSLVGSNEKNYLATSPSGSSTGFGASILLCDDLIKNSEDAYNEIKLEKDYSWFANTMLQRLEGKNWKVIIIMTRWSNNDLAGKILENFENVKLIKYKALQDDGSMLCDEILDKKDYDLKTKEMNLDIVEANYQQEPIDIKGRLYEEFKEWEDLPKFAKIYNQTDTADTGKDYLCSINYVVYDNEAYILDVLYTDESMEITESKLADMLNGGGVNECFVESNNGGRGFARNVNKLLKEEYRTNKTVIKTEVQTKNKETRILTSSSWVTNHIYMPKGWKFRYPEFYKAIMSYQRKGKNAHDDAPDVLSTIAERITGRLTPKVLTKKYVGVY
jgi:predicted phage terminase large subunit-like protein